MPSEQVREPIRSRRTILSALLLSTAPLCNLPLKATPLPPPDPMGAESAEVVFSSTNTTEEPRNFGGVPDQPQLGSLDHDLVVSRSTAPRMNLPRQRHSVRVQIGIDLRLAKLYTVACTPTAWLPDEWNPDPKLLARRAIDYYTKAIRDSRPPDVVGSGGSPRTRGPGDRETAVLQKLLGQSKRVSSYQRVTQHFLIDFFSSSSVWKKARSVG